MRFFATQEQFSRALSMTTRVIAPQNNMPILSGVQIETDLNQVRVTATDLFTVMTTSFPAEVERPGHVVLTANLITDLVHRLPTATLEVDSASDGKTTLRYGKNRAILNGFGQDRLPEFPSLESAAHEVVLPGGSLPAFSRQLLFACAKDETRPLLRGVYGRLGSGRLLFASTDGSRLSQTWVAVPYNRESVFEVIVPAKFLVEAARLAGSIQPITFRLTDTLVKVSTEDGDITSRLLDGQYPDYQRVIPQEYPVSGRVATAELRGALERVNLIASRDRAAAIRVVHRAGSLELSATSAELGQSYESVDCDSHGPDMELLFNPNYLLDGLRALEGEDVLLEFSGIQSPARFRETSGASNYWHVVLPLRQLV